MTIILPVLWFVACLQTVPGAVPTSWMAIYRIDISRYETSGTIPSAQIQDLGGQMGQRCWFQVDGDEIPTIGFLLVGGGLAGDQTDFFRVLPLGLVIRI